MKASNQLRIPVVLPLMTESEPVSAAYSTSTGGCVSEGNLMWRFSWNVENTERVRDVQPDSVSGKRYTGIWEKFFAEL